MGIRGGSQHGYHRVGHCTQIPLILLLSSNLFNLHPSSCCPFYISLLACSPIYVSVLSEITPSHCHSGNRLTGPLHSLLSGPLSGHVAGLLHSLLSGPLSGHVAGHLHSQTPVSKMACLLSRSASRRSHWALLASTPSIMGLNPGSIFARA